MNTYVSLIEDGKTKNLTFKNSYFVIDKDILYIRNDPYKGPIAAFKEWVYVSNKPLDSHK